MARATIQRSGFLQFRPPPIAVRKGQVIELSLLIPDPDVTQHVDGVADEVLLSALPPPPDDGPADPEGDTVFQAPPAGACAEDLKPTEEALAEADTSAPDAGIQEGLELDDRIALAVWTPLRTSLLDAIPGDVFEALSGPEKWEAGVGAIAEMIEQAAVQLPGEARRWIVRHARREAECIARQGQQRHIERIHVGMDGRKRALLEMRRVYGPRCDLCLNCDRPVLEGELYGEFCEYCFHEVRPHLETYILAKLRDEKRMLENLCS